MAMRSNYPDQYGVTALPQLGRKRKKPRKPKGIKKMKYDRKRRKTKAKRVMKTY